MVRTLDIVKTLQQIVLDMVEITYSLDKQAYNAQCGKIKVMLRMRFGWGFYQRPNKYATVVWERKKYPQRFYLVSVKMTRFFFMILRVGKNVHVCARVDFSKMRSECYAWKTNNFYPGN